MTDQHDAAENTAQDSAGRPVHGAAVEALSGLADRPIGEHPDVFDAVHTDLRAALRQIDGV